MTGRVWLVGAGPGDPDLITLRGRILLQRADVVVHDRLAGRGLLALAREGAELVDASKKPGRHTLTQDEIHALIVERALAGMEVVRLKGGDPFVYGRGWEEAQACAAAGVPCEVVPGLSSALAVPTNAGVPLTLRGRATTLGVFTPSVGAGLPPRELPYEALARLDTLVVLMGGGRMREVTASLMAAGKDADAPAAVVQEGTLPGERQVRGTLRNIAELAESAGLHPPVVLVVGPGAGLDQLVGKAATRSTISGPLAGRRIVLTRPTSASVGVTSRLSRLGAEVIDSPLIRIEYVDAEPWPGDAAPAWTVFTSLHGVRGFVRQLERRGLDARFFSESRVACVGPKTASELERIGIRPDLVPEVHRAQALVEAIGAAARQGDHVLFPCGTLALDEVAEGLTRQGLTVQTYPVYETLLQPLSEEAREAFRAGVDAVLLYSPSAARSLAESGVELRGARVLCVGSTTAEAVRSHGLPVDGVPESYGDAGMVELLLAVLGRSG